MKTKTDAGTKPTQGIDWEELGSAIPGFDCLAMKDQGAAQVLAETAGMTHAELLEYWAGHNAELRRAMELARE
jgi:hypothetical protein